MMHHAGQEAIVAGEVRINTTIARGHHVLTIHADRIFEKSQPGQFVMIRTQGIEEPLLSRPISIYDVRDEAGAVFLDLLIRVTGKGTLQLSRLRAGDYVEILGPLGTGFRSLPDQKKIVLIAGGIGTAPLAFLADRLSLGVKEGRRKLTCYVGARSKDALCGMERLQRSCTAVHLSTDDGSMGHRGFVTDLVERDWSTLRDNGASFYACGPLPMLKKMQTIMEEESSACQVSVEERMACGVGACLGCAIAMKDGTYGRVCKDGPVFDLNALEFE